MKLFEITTKILALSGFRPNHTHLLNVNHLVSFFAVISHLAFFFCEADNIIEYVNSAYFTTTTFGIFISFTHSIYKATNIFILIAKTEKLINKRLRYSRPRAIYTNANQTVEKFSKIMNVVVVYVTVSGFIIPKAILCFFIYTTTDAGVDAFELPLPTWLPFEWKNPAGYFFAILLQFGMLFILNVYLACFLTLALGFFVFTLSIAKDMIDEFRSMSKRARMRKPKEQLMKQLNETISMHADVKDIINMFTDVYQTTIAVLFSGSIIAICTAMLMFQVELTSDDVNSVVFLESMLYGFWAVSMLFFACEIGQRFSNAYEDIDSVVDRMNWNDLPIEIQRMLPTIMINMQRTFAIKCFGSTACSRETFKEVSNSGYTYFMVLRKFYN